MKILVLHIPKTGGTAVAEYFKGFFGDDVFGVSHNSEVKSSFEKYKTNIINEYSFIQGHIPLASMTDSIKEFDFVISVVRDPFSRLKSHCNYIDHPNFPEFFYGNYLNNVATRNEQCSYLGLINTFSSVLETLDKYPNIVVFRYDRLASGFKEFCTKNKIGNGGLTRENVTVNRSIGYSGIGRNLETTRSVCEWFADDFLLYSYLLESGRDYVGGNI